MEKEKVLISVLGKNDYGETVYVFGGLRDKTRYVLKVLRKAIKPDKLYIIGTGKSKWELADEEIGKENYEKVVIPEGRNHDEFWRIFETLISLDVDKKEVYLDITHGFRSIPVFVSTVMNFFEKVRKAEIKGVYYGMYNKEEVETPIIDMLPILEINNWIDGFTLFKDYGDSSKITNLIKSKLDMRTLDNEDVYKNILNWFDISSKAFGFTASDVYINSVNEIANISNNIEDIPSELKALEFIINDIKKLSQLFGKLDKNWQKQLKLTEVYFLKNRYSQALTTLREAIITYILEENDMDWKNFKLRQQGIEDLMRQKALPSELYKLMRDVKNIRNNANHSFINVSAYNHENIKELIETLRDYIRKTKNLLTSLNIKTLKGKLEKELMILNQHKTSVGQKDILPQ